MTEPADGRSGAPGSRDRMRVSREDRERTVELLKAAFVEDRLTHDELDTRVGQALAARTSSDLADLTADLPAGRAAAALASAGSDTAEPAAAAPTGAQPASPVAASSPARTLAKAASRAGTCLLAVLALVGILALTGENADGVVAMAFFASVFAVIAASGFMGYGVVDAVQQRRSRRAVPPRQSQDGGALEGGRPDSTSYEAPAIHGDESRLNESDVKVSHVDESGMNESRVRVSSLESRTHLPRRTRRHSSRRRSPAPRVPRPVPGAV